MTKVAFEREIPIGFRMTVATSCQGESSVDLCDFCREFLHCHRKVGFSWEEYLSLRQR